MAWTYDFTALATSQKDQLRTEIGDVDPNNPRLQDEEIEWTLTVEANYWGAAARCAEMISRVMLGKADVRLGRAMQVQYTKMAKQYSDMARTLRIKAGGSNVPYGGGVYIADKDRIGSDTSLVVPAFTRSMQENPNAGLPSSDSLDSASQNDSSL